ncbi:MAG: phosphatidylglycerophosphatase A [Terriglobia bacterium]
MAEQSRGAAVWIATLGGIGYCPVAPGTAGSLAGVVLVVAIGRTPLAQPWRSAFLAVAAFGVFVLGVWAAGGAERHFGRVDPGQVVIDEVVGQLLTFLLWPSASWKWLIAGFVLFRIFDIIKPFPARRAERLPGGWGIMTDDVVAGAYGLAVVSALSHWLT